MTIAQILAVVLAGPFALVTLFMGIASLMRPTKHGFEMEHAIIFCFSLTLILVAFFGVS